MTEEFSMNSPIDDGVSRADSLGVSVETCSLEDRIESGRMNRPPGTKETFAWVLVERLNVRECCCWSVRDRWSDWPMMIQYCSSAESMEGSHTNVEKARDCSDAPTLIGRVVVHRRPAVFRSRIDFDWATRRWSFERRYSHRRRLRPRGNLSTRC